MVADRGTSAADLALGGRTAELENPLEAKAARMIPATRTDRLTRDPRLETRLHDKLLRRLLILPRAQNYINSVWSLICKAGPRYSVGKLG